MRKTFIFDLDDTLFGNHHYYCYAQINFLKYVMDRFGFKSPDVHEMLNLQVDIDKESAEKYGFSKERFPGSLVETYRRVSKKLNHSPTKKEIEQVREIGNQAFNITPGLAPGAEEVLDFLRHQEDELMLYTKGDAEVQQKKVTLNRLERWFFSENIHIVDQKSSVHLESLVGKRCKDHTFKVGNSIRSDVDPALAAGIRVIYIPCETWAYERDHNGIDHANPRVLVINHIGDIVQHYGRL